jgi:hypothetical protein
MPDSAPNPELLPSLGRLVRGLSALFWGLPCALVVCAQTGRMEWLHAFGFLPPLVVTGILLYGLWMLGTFQKQERTWHSTLDFAKVIALINFGLSPFLYWANQMPDNLFFALMVALLALCSLLFLLSLNFVLRRLVAMLPDETLRHETRQFTTLNRNLLTALLSLIAIHMALVQFANLPDRVMEILQWMEHNALFILMFLALLPLAMTMALIWKTKEVILNSVFSPK